MTKLGMRICHQWPHICCGWTLWHQWVQLGGSKSSQKISMSPWWWTAAEVIKSSYFIIIQTFLYKALRELADPNSSRTNISRSGNDSSASVWHRFHLLPLLKSEDISDQAHLQRPHLTGLVSTHVQDMIRQAELTWVGWIQIAIVRPGHRNWTQMHNQWHSWKVQIQFINHSGSAPLYFWAN